MEFKQPYWMQIAEVLIKTEFDDPKKFYESYTSAADFYNEIAKRIITESTNESADDMTAYSLMYETFALDVRENTHDGLDALLFVYKSLTRTVE